MECLDDELVLAFAQAVLPPDARARVESHLGGCADCRKLVAEAAKFLYDDAPRPVPRPTDEAPLASGTFVGRYLVERAIGSGAAGVVYQARDPQLKRKVALKLLRTAAAPGAALLREAEAMAALAHPNVVSVFDAGRHEERVFIVMELVEGQTLTRWLRQQERPWREGLAAFVAAGRGLAAAHAVGLVHRDFKPDNVLVGADGRVRVTDFGLARPVSVVTSEETPGTSDAEMVTTAAGTPAYMAPEQFQGAPADARTDQFSFCVALYMALHGRHPLAKSDPARHAGAPPARVDDLLKRGLALAPSERHASMEVLVEALEAQLRERLPRVALVGLMSGAALAAAVVLILVRGLTPATVCGDGRVEPGEECDDRNRVDLDACRNDCRLARCGDGVVRAGVEECDDGNAVLGDGCGACKRCVRGDSAFVWDRGEQCFSFHRGPLPWDEARAACEREGTTLAAFASTFEQRAVRQALLLGQSTPVWIGLELSTGSPRWVNGEALQRTDWAPGEPRPDVGICGQATVLAYLDSNASQFPGLEWSAGHCQRALPYLCEQAPWTVRPADGHAYRLFHTKVVWEEARARCAAVGGHLATITSADEHSFVAAQPSIEFWLGGSDLGEEGVFRWVTGEPLRFTAFGPGEPDAQRPTEDYLLFGADDFWHDRSNWRGHPYLCEVE